MPIMGKTPPEEFSFNDAILASPSYIPADRHTEFMQREELRPLRLGLELLRTVSGVFSRGLLGLYQ